MADQFGESVLLLKTQDDQLKAGLKKAESAAVASNAKMTASMNGVKSSTAALGAVAGKTSASLGVVGASAGLVGGTAGAAIAPVVGLATALAGLSAPIAAAVAIISVLGVAIAAAFNLQRISDWISGVDEANERLKEQEKRLREQRKQIDATVKQQEQRLKIAKGLAVASDFIANKKVREATKAAEAAEAEKAVQAAVQASRDATVSRIQALDKARQILTGEKKEHEFIKNAMEREAFLALEKAKAEKIAADAVKAQAKAKRDALAAEGPQTTAAARLELNKLIAKQERDRIIQARRRIALESALERGVISRKQAEAASSQLGLGFFGDKPEFKPAGASTGITSRSFTDIAAVGVTAGDQRDKKRNTLLEQIANTNARMALLAEQGGGVLN